MRKLLAKFDYVPRSEISELTYEVSKALAVNAELRTQAAQREERIAQLIEDCTRHRESHDRLKEEHDKQQRAATITAKALSGLAPTMIGIRK